MPISTAGRKSARKKLASMLRGGLTAQTATIYDHQARDLAGESPVIRVMSSGSLRPEQSFKGSRSQFGFTVQLLVLLNGNESDLNESGEIWNESDAEDALDDLEMLVQGILLDPDMFRPAGFDKVTTLTTTIREDVIQGTVYLTELIPVTVGVLSG